MEERIIKWWRGEWWFLDNSYSTSILFQNMSYPSVTHAFLAAQAEGIDLKVRILHSPLTALEPLSREMGQPREGFEGPNTMRKLLEYKFGLPTSNIYLNSRQLQLAQHLIVTGKKTLIYGNRACSQFWGSCECTNHFNEKGQNVLGGLIMGVRERLIESVAKGVDMKQTCVCEAPCEAFFMYPYNERLWLKPFCSNCSGKTGQMLMKMSSTGAIYRFEKDWVKAERPPINKIIVPQNHLRPDVFGGSAWREKEFQRWEKEEEVKKEVKLPQNKTFYLSGKVI